MAHIYEKNDRKMSDLEIIKKTWPYVKPYAWKLVGVLLIMLLMIALDLASSILPGTITSQLGVIAEKFIKTPNLLKLSDMYMTFALCITALIVTVMNNVFVYITTMALQRIGQEIIYNMRMIVFEHIDNMSIAQINEIPVGSLVTRVASDTNQLSDLFTNTIVNLIKNMLMLVGVTVVMFAIDWRVSLILVAFMPIILISSWIFRNKSRANYRKVRHSFSVMNAFLNENISGMKITQIFNQEEQKETEFERLNDEIR